MASLGAAGGRIAAGAGANLIGLHASERNQEATCYVGNIDLKVTEDILWELCVQVGPVGASLKHEKIWFLLFVMFCLAELTTLFCLQ